MSKIGFIGTGTMGATVARLVAASAGECELFFSNRSQEKAEILAQELQGAQWDNHSIARHCEMIFLGVKPQMMADVLGDIAPILRRRRDHFTLISMAAGLSISRLQTLAEGDYPIIRMMPNTPLLVESAVVQYCATKNCQHLQEFARWMRGGGIVDHIDEGLMDAATAVSGCGPAFCAIFLEALADGGVLCGLPRQKALDYAARTLIGTGELMRQMELHPALLKDGVCSPAGSTIRGVAALEEAGLRNAVIQAVRTAFEANHTLGK